MAANIDTSWNVIDGEWTSSGNWTNGVPSDLSPSDTNRTQFIVNSQSGAVSNVTLGAGQAGTFNQLNIGAGKTVNLSLGNNAQLAGNSLALDSLSHLRIEGPQGGQAEVNFSTFFNIGGNATASGNTLTLSGDGLSVKAGSTVTIGRMGNGHSMVVENGASFQGGALVVSGTVNTTSGVGNNNQLVVRGAGTDVKLSGGGALGLIVGARPLTGSSSSNVQKGNRVLVEDGGTLTVANENLGGSVVEVLVGAAIYRTDNSIDVSGAGSVFEVSGNTRTRIGHSNDSSYNNRLTVSDGGVFRTDAEIAINNGTSIAAGRRNILSIGAGGKLVSSSVINNNGGLVRMANGGEIIGQTLAGSSTGLALNINGTGRFEAEGDGLGNTVTVNVGDDSTKQAVFAVGLAGHNSATSITIDSSFNMNDGSLLEVAIFGNGSIDTIILGNNADFVIGEDVGLRVLTSGYSIKAGDQFQLFGGNLSAISGSFSETLLDLPQLAGGLSWDLSAFNVNGNWTLTVVPEASEVALIMGVSALAVLGVARRSRARRARAV